MNYVKVFNQYCLKMLLNSINLILICKILLILRFDLKVFNFFKEEKDYMEIDIYK